MVKPWQKAALLLSEKSRTGRMTVFETPLARCRSPLSPWQSSVAVQRR
jgi:hypothetical protein